MTSPNERPDLPPVPPNAADSAAPPPEPASTAEPPAMPSPAALPSPAAAAEPPAAPGTGPAPRAAPEGGARSRGWRQEARAGRSPEARLADCGGAYEDRIRALGSLPDDKLTDADALSWVGEPVVDVDFTGHLHDEHVPAVRAWLAGAPRG